MNSNDFFMNQQIPFYCLPDYYNSNQKSIFDNPGWIELSISNAFSYELDSGNVITIYFDDKKKKYFNINWEEIKNLNIYNLNPKKEIVTKIDLLNFKWLSDKEIEQLINKELQVDLNTEEWIGRVNEFFKKWIDFLEGLWRTLPPPYNNNLILFSSKEDIISFCKDITLKWKKKAYINCLISKSVSVVSDIINNESRVNLEEKLEFLINKYFKNRREFSFTTNNRWKLSLWKRDIDFSFSARHKSEKSSKIKVAKDPKYFSSRKFCDDIWFTFFTKNKEESLLLMAHILRIFCGDDCDSYNVKNRNYFSNDLINANLSKINTWLADQIINWETWKKVSTNDNYSWAKATLTSNIPEVDKFDIEWAVWDDIWIELAFDIFDSKNEYWLSFHPVFDFSKYFDIMCRIYQGYIWEWEIDFICEEFFMQLDENLAKKNKLLPKQMEKTKENYFKELEDDLSNRWLLGKTNKSRTANKDELKKWLKNYYLSFLLRVKVEWRLEIYYTTAREYNLSLAWFRPKMTPYKKKPL